MGRAIRSVLAQTHKKIELIIVDDGSTDDTRRIVSGFADDRIRYLRHAHNQGQNPALNAGVRAAKGQYVAFLDSDDEWLPEFLERVLWVFQEDQNLGAVYTQAWVSRGDDTLVEGYRFSLRGSIYREALAQGYLSYMITIVVKRDYLERLGSSPFDTEFVVCQDNDFCFRIAKLCRVGLVSEPLAIIHDDGGKDRLISNRVAYAEGWRMLIEKYKADILSECGAGVLATHYLKGVKYYLNAKQMESARQWAALAYRLKPASLSLMYMMFTSLPDWIALGFWEWLREAWGLVSRVRRTWRRTK